MIVFISPVVRIFWQPAQFSRYPIHPQNPTSVQVDAVPCGAVHFLTRAFQLSSVQFAAVQLRSEQCSAVHLSSIRLTYFKLFLRVQYFLKGSVQFSLFHSLFILSDNSIQSSFKLLWPSFFHFVYLTYPFTSSAVRLLSVNISFFSGK